MPGDALFRVQRSICRRVEDSIRWQAEHMSGITLELVFIFILLVANGVFAMAEIALVASRKARLKTLADEGHSGAKLALVLATTPGKFLSTVQVGITLVGVLAGAFGGARIAGHLTPFIEKIPGLSHEISENIAQIGRAHV